MTINYTTHHTTIPSALEVDENPDTESLEAAYDFCMEMFKLHAKSFYFASRYLEDAERRSFAALYAFCRLVDDFADELDMPKEQIEKELDLLDTIVEKLSQGVVFDDPLFRAFGDTMTKCSIPPRYLHELIDGVRMDINLTEIKTIRELDKYCYQVASTVGIMMCHIWGATAVETLERAADLGRALQLTNILRDIAEDYESGRIYIPRETREKFRVDISDFENQTVGPNFKWMIRSEIARARSIYAAAEVGIPDLPPGGQFTVKVASRVYSEIMAEIEKMDYEVFSKRAVVPKWKKLWIAYKLRREYKREKKAYLQRQEE